MDTSTSTITLEQEATIRGLEEKGYTVCEVPKEEGCSIILGNGPVTDGCFLLRKGADHAWVRPDGKMQDLRKNGTTSDWH